MFKKFLCLSSLLMVLLVTACSNDVTGSEDNVQSPALRVDEDLINVEFTALNDLEMDASVIALRLFNGTDETIIYGEPFTLERFDEGAWQVVPAQDEIFFVDVGYSLPPNESAYFDRHVAIILPNGFTQPGRYRLRMHVFNDANVPIRDEHLHDVVAEFYVH
ncbi:MAG: hypothetical protein FWE07_07805 [Turicibacter sp.]|nr:hypothetical protein [Turicibacter sp.]